MSDTKKRLNNAIDNTVNNNPNAKIVISKIAKAAGVSNATIHNRHPDIMDRITAHNANFIKEASQADKEQIRSLKERNKALTEENRELKVQVAKLVSINARYELQFGNFRNKG